ncbi:MAG: 50S ribosomal protein L10 [Bacteroidota bacterium]|nr:50S ribosomal protein L10 [Bacteroidota bacterium]MDP4205798.1 50S ribosomal protein L10 [Bacteroidota bacterium]
MKKSEKEAIINSLTEQINSTSHFYLADIEALDAENTSALRRLCFERQVKLMVVKNTLLHKALEASEKNAEELYQVLSGNTSIMFTESGSLPAKLIKEFRKKSQKNKPLLKGAYVEESVYVGEDQLDVLATLKTREELIGDIIGLLQSPAKNVISALQSGGNILTGVLKTLEDKKE